MSHPALTLFEEKTNDALSRLTRVGWTGNFSDILSARASRFMNPNVTRFFDQFSKIPRLESDYFKGDQSVVEIGNPEMLLSGQASAIESGLRGLIPWRKGPFNLFGVTVDAEWQSNQKWDRINRLGHLFHDARILDIGCNSGYYMFRMAGYRPKIVLGIDPSDLFFFQFHSLFQSVPQLPLAYLPIRLDELSGGDKWFDTVVCMGILYHQRSPIEALRGLRQLIQPDGAVILETLIIDSDGDFSITPKKSYSKMANVYYLPTLTCLMTWIERAGFQNATVVDVTRTSVDEQRQTEWVNTESLANFLDPLDSSKTVEGYPAPMRAIVVCRI